MGRTIGLAAFAAMLAVLTVAGWARAETAPEDASADEAEAGGAADEAGAPDGSAQPLRRSSVMEIEPRVIKGHRATSGAIYLFKRTARSLPGLVRLRTTYRSRIVSPVLGSERPRATARPSDEAAPPRRRERRGGDQTPPACVDRPSTPPSPR